MNKVSSFKKFNRDIKKYNYIREKKEKKNEKRIITM